MAAWIVVVVEPFVAVAVHKSLVQVGSAFGAFAKVLGAEAADNRTADKAAESLFITFRF